MKEHLENFCNEFNNSFYFLAGAGARIDTMPIAIWDDLAGSSLLFNANDNKEIREIEILTIDNLIDSGKIDLPELVKLDIQGFELEALKGAKKTFGYTEAYIMEASLFPFNAPGMPVIADVINFMLDRNYVVYDFPGFSRRPCDGALGQCDICFVKQNGFLRASNAWN